LNTFFVNSRRGGIILESFFKKARTFYQVAPYMGVGQLLGGGGVQNFRGRGGRTGMAKIVDTVFDAQFFPF
jgi:hypothetical protein